jgi:protein-tyrosine phosphatase
MLRRAQPGWIYAAIRGFPDRLRHLKRHRAVANRLSRMPRPQTILVICSGNVCRSPYLEAVLRRALPDIRISSAGFVGRGLKVPEFSLAISAQRGIDLSTFRSRSFTPREARDADLVVVMDALQARHLELYAGVRSDRIVVAGDLDPLLPSTRAIQDPWQQPLPAFVESFDRLDRCGASLTRMLGPQPDDPPTVQT